MIFGIGTDLVKIERMQTSLDKYGDRFARRILTDKEYVEFENRGAKAAFLAKRFAAKEATAKAMGTGFSQGLSLRHIGIDNNEQGRPSLYFSGVADAFIQKEKITAAHLSLADEKDYALAFVTLVR